MNDSFIASLPITSCLLLPTLLLSMLLLPRCCYSFSSCCCSRLTLLMNCSPLALLLSAQAQLGLAWLVRSARMVARLARGSHADE